MVTIYVHGPEANQVADRLEIRQGDNREVAPVGVADRVLLGLIPTSEMSWETGVKALKPSGGYMHVHENCQEGGEEEMGARLCTALEGFARKLGRTWSARVEHIEKVKPHSRDDCSIFGKCFFLVTVVAAR